MFGSLRQGLASVADAGFKFTFPPAHLRTKTTAQTTAQTLSVLSFREVVATGIGAPL